MSLSDRSEHGATPPPRGAPLAAGTLGRRLLSQVVLLVALLAVVLGTASTLVTHRLLLSQVDEQLDAVSVRQQHAPRPSGGPPLGIDVPGQPIGTLVLSTDPNGTSTGAVLAETTDHRPAAIPMSAEAAEQVRAASDPLRHVTVTDDGLGRYRVSTSADGQLIIGIPLSGVDGTIRTLIAIELGITVVALLAAGLITRSVVVRSLRPLNRLAHVSHEVASTPLHTGSVELGRVPEPGPEVSSEVVELGASLNAMLSHVEQAFAAREASESQVRSFVADASHELRNPLATIRGYAELTKRDRTQLPADPAHALGRIESEAARMSALVDDLLLLARLDAGRDLEVTDTDLSELVVNALSDARATGPDHHWRLRLSSADPVVVPADTRRLQQVLVNLLANALVHTPPGTTVEVGLDRSAAGEAVVTVRDDGPGVPAELQERVFERFMRADAGRSRAGGNTSTGLGLAIVSAIVAAHDGKVMLLSRPGLTEFTVVLPPGGGAGAGSSTPGDLSPAPAAGVPAASPDPDCRSDGRSD